MTGVHNAILSFTPPPSFSFWRTVYSHGWSTLLPYRVDEKAETLSRILLLRSKNPVECILSESSRGIRVEVNSRNPLTPRDRNEIRSQLKACLRLDEDYSAFYALTRRDPKFRWVSRLGAGRLLRAPTVYEDLIKTLCTTNCTWALTQLMTANLVNELGTPLGDGRHAFPTPEQMAGKTEQFYRTKIRSGYRSPYLLEFAKLVAVGRLDVESWRSSPATSESLYKEIRRVKGVGDYAAGSLMRLLGRYDSLALDSWVRSKYFELYRNGRRVRDTTIERGYRRYGSWRGLIFWLDMTKEWMTEKFPF